MRLDKYLKVSRIIKRRSVANEACSTSHVSVNGKPAKPSAEVKPGDILELSFGSKKLRVEVLQISEYMPKEKTDGMYRVLSTDE